jgi:hypothetical protein
MNYRSRDPGKFPKGLVMANVATNVLGGIMAAFIQRDQMEKRLSAQREIMAIKTMNDIDIPVAATEGGREQLGLVLEDARSKTMEIWRESSERERGLKGYLKGEPKRGTTTSQQLNSIRNLWEAAERKMAAIKAAEEALVKEAGENMTPSIKNNFDLDHELMNNIFGEGGVYETYADVPRKPNGSYFRMPKALSISEALSNLQKKNTVTGKSSYTNSNNTTYTKERRALSDPVARRVAMEEIKRMPGYRKGIGQDTAYAYERDEQTGITQFLPEALDMLGETEIKPGMEEQAIRQLEEVVFKKMFDAYVPEYTEEVVKKWDKDSTPTTVKKMNDMFVLNKAKHITGEIEFYEGGEKKKEGFKNLLTSQLVKFDVNGRKMAGWIGITPKKEKEDEIELLAKKDGVTTQQLIAARIEQLLEMGPGVAEDYRVVYIPYEGSEGHFTDYILEGIDDWLKSIEEENQERWGGIGQNVEFLYNPNSAVINKWKSNRDKY